jgi:hypothetical protein
MAGKSSRDGSTTRPPAELSNTSSIALRVSASNFAAITRDSDKKDVMQTSSMEVEDAIEPVMIRVVEQRAPVYSPDKRGKGFSLPEDE